MSEHECPTDVGVTANCHVCEMAADATTLCDVLRAEITRLRERVRELEAEGASEPLTVAVTGGRLVVSIGIATLVVAAENAPEACDSMATLRVTDASVFAESIARALRREQEDGSSRVTELLDAAISDAIDDGDDGFEIDWPQDLKP